MMIGEWKIRIKDFWEENRADVYLVLGIALIAILSFSVGRLSVSFSPKPPITVEEIPIQLVAGTIGEASEELGIVTASKRGKKYHLPDCPGAKQTGYRPAANCPGLR